MKHEPDRRQRDHRAQVIHEVRAWAAPALLSVLCLFLWQTLVDIKTAVQSNTTQLTKLVVSEATSQLQIKHISAAYDAVSREQSKRLDLLERRMERGHFENNSYMLLSPLPTDQPGHGPQLEAGYTGRDTLPDMRNATFNAACSYDPQLYRAARLPDPCADNRATRSTARVSLPC